MNSNESSVDSRASRLRPRWYQFSLRTALILVTLFCVLFGAWILPSERQRRECEKLSNNRGLFAFAGEKIVFQSSTGSYVSTNPSLLRYHHYFKNVELVYCRGNDNLDWAAFPHLKQLRYDGATEKLVTSISSHNRELERIQLHSVPINKNVVDCLKSLPKLKELHLSGSLLDDQNIDSLVTLDSLESFDVVHADVSDEVIEKLAKLPKLATITILIPDAKHSLREHTTKQLKIIDSFPSLKRIDIWNPDFLLSLSRDQLKKSLKKYEGEKDSAELLQKILADWREGTKKQKIDEPLPPTK